jgi:hypothetical protein
MFYLSGKHFSNNIIIKLSTKYVAFVSYHNDFILFLILK